MRRLVSRLDRGMAIAGIVSLLAVVPLLDDRVLLRDDGGQNLAALLALDNALRDGALWPRWVADAMGGYGFPVFTVISPFPFFFAEIFVVLGFGSVNALRSAFAVAMVGSAVAMYLLGRRLYGPAGGLVSAVVSVYLPSHLVALQARGSFSELFAFAWMPLVLWSLLRLEGRPDGDDAFVSDGRLTSIAPTLRSVAVAGVSIGGMILTDGLLTLLFAPLVVVFILWRLGERLARGDGSVALARLAGRIAGACALGIAFGAIYWVPLFVELPLLEASGSLGGSFLGERSVVHPVQLFAPYRSIGGSLPGPNDALGFQLGLVALVLGGFALAGSPLSISKRARRTALFFALASGIFAVLTTPIAQPIWAMAPGGGLLGALWRLLAVSAVMLSALAGAAVAGLEARFSDRSAALRTALPFGFAAVVASWMLLRVDAPPLEASATGQHSGAQVRPTLSVVWFNPLVGMVEMVEPLRRGEPPQRWQMVDFAAGRIEAVLHRSASHEARVRVPNGGRVLLQTIDYPGWTVRIDGRVVEHQRLPPLGLIAIDVPPGDHVVTARFETTPARLLGGGLSLVAAVIAGALFALRRRRER